jgi:hypothetical protein
VYRGLFNNFFRRQILKQKMQRLVSITLSNTAVSSKITVGSKTFVCFACVHHANSAGRVGIWHVHQVNWPVGVINFSRIQTIRTFVS